MRAPADGPAVCGEWASQNESGDPGPVQGGDSRQARRPARPTTVLAHTLAHLERTLSPVPNQGALLNRCRTSKRTQRRPPEGLKAGTVDVVGGNHQLLGKGTLRATRPAWCGLKKQAFGVQQKEKIKALRKDGVLTLSPHRSVATLYMSLPGAREP